MQWTAVFAIGLIPCHPPLYSGNAVKLTSSGTACNTPSRNYASAPWAPSSDDSVTVIHLRTSSGTCRLLAAHRGGIPLGVMTIFHSNNRIRCVRAFDDRGRIQGEELWYDRGGRLRAALPYVDSVFHGFVRHYHPDGSLRAGTSYHKGIMHGISVESLPHKRGSFDSTWYDMGRIVSSSARAGLPLLLPVDYGIEYLHKDLRDGAQLMNDIIVQISRNHATNRP